MTTNAAAKKGLIVLVALVAMMAMATASWAAGQLSAGPLKLRGEVMGSWSYESNIFKTERNETSDNIYKIEPILGLRHDVTGTSWYSLEYQGIFAWYADNKDNDWTSHLLHFDSFFGSKQGPYLKVKDIYINTEDPFGSENLYREGQKTKRWLNQFRIAPGYQFGELSRAEVFYENRYTKYDLQRDANQNQNENHFGATYYHKFWPKTSALVQYRYVTREYFDQPSSRSEDFHRNDIFVGLAWDATAKLSGEFKVGYSMQDYDNTANVAGQQFEKKDTWAVEGDLAYQVTPNISLMLRLIRAIQESTVANSNYYIDTNATLGARWMVINNVSLLASGTIGQNDYNSLDGSPSRDDKVYKAELGAEYSFLRYLFLRAGYRLDKKDSNVTNSSYTDNIYFVGLGGRF